MMRLVFFKTSIVWSFDIRIISPRHATYVNSSLWTLGAVVNTNSMQIYGHSLRDSPTQLIRNTRTFISKT